MYFHLWLIFKDWVTGCSALPDWSVAWPCTPPSPCCVLAAVPEAKVWEEEFDLNSVRLCFQASITLSTGELIPLEPAVSQPIYDNSEWITYTMYMYNMFGFNWFTFFNASFCSILYSYITYSPKSIVNCFPFWSFCQRKLINLNCILTSK